MPALEELGAREEQATGNLQSLATPLQPRGGRTIELPRLTMTPVRMSFSLNDVTDLDAFEKLGRQLAVAPQDDLRREEIVAEVVRDGDGLPVTRLGTRRGERVEAEEATIELAVAREKLVDAVLHADVVTLRIGEDAGAERIVDAFLRGIGDDAERVLGGFLQTAAGRLVRAVTAEHRRFLSHPGVREGRLGGAVRAAADRARRDERRPDREVEARRRLHRLCEVALRPGLVRLRGRRRRSR